MRMSRCAVLSPALALVSLALTLSLWAWIWSQPPSAFHDQGGLAITLIYFPIAGLGWVAFGLPAFILGILGVMNSREQVHRAVDADDDSEGVFPPDENDNQSKAAKSSAHRGRRGWSIALSSCGLMLSVAGLATAILTLLVA